MSDVLQLTTVSEGSCQQTDANTCAFARI